jgi:tetratricopeptide (TPR) repeat protein
MSAFDLFGRILAVMLFVSTPGALLAQPILASSQPAAADAVAFSTVPAHPQSVTASDEDRGDSFLMRQEYQSAIAAYSRAAQPSARLWNKLGIAYQMLFDARNAARCYKESLKLDPNLAGALNNLATIDDERNDYAAAERLYRRAVKIEPGSARILKNLGTNLIMQHKYRESSEAYAQALAIDPHIFDRHSGPSTETHVSTWDRGETSYVTAQSCARAGLNDCAIAQLRKAFDEGSATRKRVTGDDDFASLRQTREYERLLAEQP